MKAAYDPPKKTTRKKSGRKLDESRNSTILFAALEVLAEDGYNGMTMDAVAAKAKAGKGTMYRRWPSKESLVLEAIGKLKEKMVDLKNLPNTGVLRSDLLALFKPQTREETERTLKIMSGMASMLSQNRDLSEAVNSVVVGPWLEAYLILIKRAVQRGEVSKSIDSETVAQIIPSMAAYRAMILRKPFDRQFLLSMIDAVLMPALGIKTNSK